MFNRRVTSCLCLSITRARRVSGRGDRLLLLTEVGFSIQFPIPIPIPSQARPSYPPIPRTLIRSSARSLGSRYQIRLPRNVRNAGTAAMERGPGSDKLCAFITREMGLGSRVADSLRYHVRSRCGLLDDLQCSGFPSTFLGQNVRYQLRGSEELDV